ncbi:MAG: tyrosine-type recombinase/integrase [Syntrophobacteraceae bacterium]
MSAIASSAMPRRLPPGCVEDRDRHGNVRIYFRAKGRPKARLRGTPWTPEFMAAYEAAKGAAAEPSRKSGIAAGTWRWLCVKYFGECADYKRLDPQTQHVRRLILESTFDEPIAPGSAKLFRDMPLSRMGTDAVEVLRDRKLAFPESANSRVKAIRAVLKWAIRKKGSDGKALILHNPARDVPYLKSNNPSGYHTWTLEEVHRFQERHPIGTKARLALALLLFTGQRRSDITRFGRQHVRDGKISFTQFKGRNRKPKRLVLPILPALQHVIDASPCGALAFLVNDLERPFTDAGFGNKFREWCDQAGLNHCTAHGLRKAGATIAANNGATAHQLMAIFGWETLRMAEAYTRAADQERLAEAAMHMLEAPEQNSTESSPIQLPGGTLAGKSSAKSTKNLKDGARGGSAPIEKLQRVTTSNPAKTLHSATRTISQFSQPLPGIDRITHSRQ